MRLQTCQILKKSGDETELLQDIAKLQVGHQLGITFKSSTVFGVYVKKTK